MQQENVEHTATYEIAFGAGADLAVVIPGLDTTTLVREAHRYHQLVAVLELPLWECIEAYCHGYRAYEEGLV